MVQNQVSWIMVSQIHFAWVQTQVVHGIPNNKPSESGDVISVDCGAFKTDTMVTMPILLK
jgi:hypothetical protein